MDLREAMRPFINALSDAIILGNWHLALMPALTLPDICCSLEGRRGGKWYIKWFDTYSSKTYNLNLHRRIGSNKVKTLEEYQELTKQPFTPDIVETFNIQLLNGTVVYTLRCAFLHNGDAIISEQDVHKDNPNKTLDINKIKFIHDDIKIYNKIGDIVELDAKRFCEEILVCVEKWITLKENTPKVIKRAKRMIHFIA